MVKTLVLNGSPRGEGSNTMKVTRAFCAGLEAEGEYRMEHLNVRSHKIGHCTGCFSCWTKSPGRCVLQDDMTEILEKIMEADLVIWSFPLYFFGMPSKIKALMDRMLPLSQPEIIQKKDGTASHPSRHDLSSQRTVLISTCGFFTRENNYEGLQAQFRILQGENDQEAPLQILCPEGELLSIPQLSGRTGAYLEFVKKAGGEFALEGEVSETTRSALEEVFYPPEAFLEMTNAYWDSNKEDDKEKKDPGPQARRFMTQMAASYRRESYIKDLVIEMAFTDLKEVYGLEITEDRCILHDGPTEDGDVRIETPFETWRNISEGRKNGAQAMMDGLYRVTGDFDVMNRMTAMFGGSEKVEEDQVIQRPKRANMNLLLVPWIALWVLLPMGPLVKWGGIAGIGLSSLVTLLGFIFRLTPYDRLTTALVSALGVAVLMDMNPSFLFCLSYGLFGALWIMSSLTRVPLTAHYSSGKYGGNEAFGNPLFIKTNRILTNTWGICYILLAVVSWFLLHSPLKPYTGIINQGGPVVLGVFTWWFQRWYPAKVARGGSHATA